MGMVVWLVLLALCQIAHTVPVDSEDDILPYLRGMGWRNVENELKKDLRLDPTVRPISYDINLNISVRGYLGAKRSTFDGFVSISLNTTTPKDAIELHSVALNIQKIYYNGTAVMRGVGLFEYWTKPEHPTPSTLPTISLASSCEPTGARRWVPSFDEPDKKAKFRLRVTHPDDLTAYSNTAIREMSSRGVTTTTFFPTVALPTYLVALALTAQPVVEIAHNGQRIRAIGRDLTPLVNELKDSMDHIRNLPVFENVTFFPEKTDWLVVDDYFSGAMENPGLIISHNKATDRSIQIHELAHMYFGNLVTLRSWEQIWVNEGFARYFQTGGEDGTPASRILGSISGHEPAIHEKFSYAKSQFVTSHFKYFMTIHYDKAGQLIRLIKRVIGEEAFNRALNRYLIDNSFGNGDSAMMIDYLSTEVPQAREIMNDFVYQAGIPLLSVEEEHDHVIITQRRFLRTDFIAELRDTTSRWTIPLYYKINGVQHSKLMQRDDERFIIETPANCSFSIDDSYPRLYIVHYTNRKSNDRLSQIIAQTEIADEVTTKSTIASPKPTSPRLFPRKRDSKEELITFCNTNAVNKTGEELMDAYLIEEKHAYLLCDSKLQNEENAKSELDIIIPIYAASLYEEGGVEKLREIVRKNPSFAANFNHFFTKIFEEDFIRTEMKKRETNASKKSLRQS